MADRSHSPVRSKASFCRDVSSRVLKACQQIDPNSVLASVLKDNKGRTVVRVRSGESASNPIRLLGCLKERWPLANTAVVENSLDGTIEAQIVIPNAGDEWKSATNKAKAAKISEAMLLISMVSLVAGLAQFALDELTTFSSNISHSHM